MWIQDDFVRVSQLKAHHTSHKNQPEFVILTLWNWNLENHAIVTSKFVPVPFLQV